MAARILVADDDATLQRLLFHTLKLEGYEVTVAHDGQEALDMVSKSRPDLLILDVMMPVHNGFEVCKILRDRPETATMPIIMLSGLVETQEKVSGFRAGADEYVTKPIDLRELTARVDALLKRNWLLRQSAARKAGRLITVIGAKGGVGVTTMVLNMAALIAKGGKSAIAAEIRPDYGTFAAQLRTPTPEKNLSGLMRFDAAAISEPLVASHLFTTPFDVRILFGPQAPEQCLELEAARTGAVLGRLAYLADYVVVDLSSVPSPAHETVIKNSGFVILVLEPEVTAVAATQVRLQQLELWGATSSMMQLLVVNRQSAMLLSLREMENRIGRMIGGVVPPATEALGIAVQYGTPLTIYQPEHVASTNLAEFVIHLIDKPVSLPHMARS